jgi:hypothetical protein
MKEVKVVVDDEIFRELELYEKELGEPKECILYRVLNLFFRKGFIDDFSWTKEEVEKLGKLVLPSSIDSLDEEDYSKW